MTTPRENSLRLDDLVGDMRELKERLDALEKAAIVDPDETPLKAALGVRRPARVAWREPLPCPDDLEEHRKADYHQADEDCPVAVRRAKQPEPDEEWKAVWIEQEVALGSSQNVDPDGAGQCETALAKLVVQERASSESWA